MKHLFQWALSETGTLILKENYDRILIFGEDNFNSWISILLQIIMIKKKDTMFSLFVNQ